MWLFYVVAWAAEMALIVFMLLAYGILVATGLVDASSERQSVYPGIGALVTVAVFLIALYYAYFAVTVKRLHDRNKSAWWLLVFFVVPMLLIFASEIPLEARLISPDDERMRLALFSPGLIGMALSIWGFVEIYCLRGTVGDNRYGADPLAGRA